MLARGIESLRAARQDGHALGAFTTYNLECTQAIIAAAERLRKPVIVQAGAAAFAYAGREPLAAMVLAIAATSTVAVGVHLDHSRNLEEIASCISLGYTSVMIDGSNLPFEGNIAITREAVTLAHDSGVWVEGELGAIGGDENISVDADPTSQMTDPEVVRTFITETGVDALAVAVGNIHGITKAAEIDLARLSAVQDESSVPLVLHGASGLPDEVLRAVVRLGVAKINVNTELRRAFFDGLRDGLSSAKGDSIDAVMRPARRAVEQVVERKLTLL
jgi:tagatose 1,6-diphosphate aldolase GatY/KbaY